MPLTRSVKLCFYTVCVLVCVCVCVCVDHTSTVRSSDAVGEKESSLFERISVSVCFVFRFDFFLSVFVLFLFLFWFFFVLFLLFLFVYCFVSSFLKFSICCANHVLRKLVLVICCD